MYKAFLVITCSARVESTDFSAAINAAVEAAENDELLGMFGFNGAEWNEYEVYQMRWLH